MIKTKISRLLNPLQTKSYLRCPNPTKIFSLFGTRCKVGMYSEQSPVESNEMPKRLFPENGPKINIAAWVRASENRPVEDDLELSQMGSRSTEDEVASILYHQNLQTGIVKISQLQLLSRRKHGAPQISIDCCEGTPRIVPWRPLLPPVVFPCHQGGLGLSSPYVACT